MFCPYTNCLPPFSLTSWCWLLKIHTRERKAFNLITWRCCLTKEDKKNVKARYLGDFSWNFPRHFTVKKCKKNCLVPNLSVAANAARTRIKLYFLRRLVQLKSSVWRKSESASWELFWVDSSNPRRFGCFYSRPWQKHWAVTRPTWTWLKTRLKSSGLSFPSISVGSRPSPPYMNCTIWPTELRTVKSYWVARSSKDWRKHNIKIC